MIYELLTYFCYWLTNDFALGMSKFFVSFFTLFHIYKFFLFSWVRNGRHHHFRDVMTATDMRYFLSFHIFRSIWTLALIEAFACKREKMVNISVWVISFPRPFLEFLRYCDKKEFLEFISLRWFFMGDISNICHVHYLLGEAYKV